MKKWILKMAAIVLLLVPVIVSGQNKVTRPTKKTEQAITKTVNKQLSGTHSGYEWVDLGLPSGTKWATCNIDADSPYELGNYYRRSETYPAKIGVFECSKNHNINVPGIKWGGRWRLPTREEVIELTSKCKITVESKSQNWVYRITGPNNKYILLIAGGDFLWNRGASRDNGYRGVPQGESRVCYLSSSIVNSSPTILAIDYDESSDKILYKGWRLEAESCGALIRPVFK